MTMRQQIMVPRRSMNAIPPEIALETTPEYEFKTFPQANDGDVTRGQKNPGACRLRDFGFKGGGRERRTGCRALRLGGYFVTSRTR